MKDGTTVEKKDYTIFEDIIANQCLIHEIDNFVSPHCYKQNLSQIWDT